MRRLLRTPLWLALFIALAGWATDFGEPVAHIYWNVLYKNWHHQAPQSIVVVNTADIATLGAAGEAQLIDIARQSNPHRLYIDTKLQFGADKSGDARLRDVLGKLGSNAVFVVRPVVDTAFTKSFIIPDASLVHHHPIVVAAWATNFLSYVEHAPYWVDIDGARYPTVSTDLSGVHSGFQSDYYADFSVDPGTIPTISGRDLLDGKVRPDKLSGKSVMLTSFDARDGRTYYFGHGLVNPVAHDIAGAVALERPVNASLTGLAMLSLVFGLLYLGHNAPRKRIKLAIYATVLGALVILPAALRTVGLVATSDSALLLVLLFAGMRIWQKRTRRIQHTSASGLPNMLALSASTLPIGCDVVVAAIARYDEMLATLPRDLRGECSRQIARRISVGCGATEVYHSDGGHFSWTEEARPLDMQLSHLEGLRALFASPLQVGPHTFDTNIHFGLDRNEGVETATRVNSALASANEALANGRAIELFEAHRLAEAPWELSLHARIDEGLRNGDIWLAFQSQWDVASHRICGAEALIRWNHPTRGPIAPNAFILQAERAGRIDALTYWVLDQAITATLAINAKGERFQMSVNLSGQMVDKPDLVRNFAEITARRGVDPGLITVEITETSSMGNRAAAVFNLSQLRQLGFRLSIDDFGTGEASLAYLADLPSDELKLDRRFIARICDSERERAIVASTIGLAHALGQTVVAEGIEDAPTLALLRDMGCDQAQGFYLGRPQPFAVFEREYDANGIRRFGHV
ncbi:EAL domain-containing protein [Novosphingobium sp.]|uniref:EAL domain-containing protein n=1 Tax=Novosphingobium sp. TaxID=1874826 RepID=UPI003D0BB787